MKLLKSESRILALFTDFGMSGPYVGQIKAVLSQRAPETRIIDIMHDAPRYDPVSSGYLLAALANEFPVDTVFFCVVDPGVGGERQPIAFNLGTQWFVGPENGLFNVLAAQATTGNDTSWWRIEWQPLRQSSSFHGRDLFAPIAAMLANGDDVPLVPIATAELNIESWPADVCKIIYIDHFGNAITGLRSHNITSDNILLLKGHEIAWAKTFSDVNPGQIFWYSNSNDLVEIAVNQDGADIKFNLQVGDAFQVMDRKSHTDD